MRSMSFHQLGNAPDSREELEVPVDGDDLAEFWNLHIEEMHQIIELVHLAKVPVPILRLFASTALVLFPRSGIDPIRLVAAILRRVHIWFQRKRTANALVLIHTEGANPIPYFLTTVQLKFQLQLLNTFLRPEVTSYNSIFILAQSISENSGHQMHEQVPPIMCHHSLGKKSPIVDGLNAVLVQPIHISTTTPRAKFVIIFTVCTLHGVEVVIAGRVVVIADAPQRRGNDSCPHDVVGSV
mmetsp:Transcript_8062/g.17432  ORF Transcript_8062/g.17432 Transcript_8062/m.17432 type:complete len:240 (-) Transcript_8062:720-1439(-)